MAEIRGCAFPDDLAYDQELNLWFRQVSASVWQVGVTPFGLALSGEVYMFNPKPVGRQIDAGRAFAVIEVAKTILTVRSPFACTLEAVNENLESKPAWINRQPYESWLVRLVANDPQSARAALLTGDAVARRALECMALHQFLSPETFRPTGGLS